MIGKLWETYKKMPVQAKASVCFLICSFLQRGISVITTPIFTRVMSTSEYGLFSVFNSWMQLITPIISLNLYSGVYSQGVVKFEEDRACFSSSLQGLMLTLMAAWLLIYYAFRNYINTWFSLDTLQITAMFVLIWLSGSYTFWSMEQRVDFRYQKIVVVTVLISLVQPLLSLFFMLNSENRVNARILGMLISHLVFYFWTFVVQMKNGKTFASKYYWQYALRFNLPLVPHYLSLTVLSSSDRIMISNMAGEDKAGIYNLAYSVSMIMAMFNNALLQTIEPWIYKKIKNRKVTEMAPVAYASFVLIAVVNLLLIMFAPEVVAIFAPREYLEAIYIIPAVAISVYFMFMYTFFATFEFYYEKKIYIVSATIGGAILNIILNFIFIKSFGYIAAGYTTLFSYILFALLHYVFMRKVCREYMDDVRPYNVKTILLITAITMVLAFVFLLTYGSTILRYSIILLIMCGILMGRKKLCSIGKNMWQTVKKEKKT